MKNINDYVYQGARLICAIFSFFISWAYCINHYGILFGGGLGWMLAYFIAIAVYLLFPLALLTVFAVIMYRAFIYVFP